MNMDYALSEAISTTLAHNAPHCIVVYDIMCQYYRYLRRRVAESKFLTIPESLKIIPGIGLFHVHGHQETCLPRYAPSFIDFAGQADGEILETLWSVLNNVGRTSRTMTLAHRSEVLDSHMCDSNWKKLVNMSRCIIGTVHSTTNNISVSRLCKKYKLAEAGFSDAQEAFELLNSSANSEQISLWTDQASEASKNRVNFPEAMDIYLVKAQPGMLEIII
jgi:hypothetical protein